ncbi:hypothetical protein [Micromonospora sp. DT47]|uniref:hypothetical protein n=1 Tax=Micromonospora sp. DT47 TaxID=3393431 RepID=UPI003CF6A050
MKRSDILQAAVGAGLAGGAQIACGFFVANSVWGGRDSPAEWTFYYASAGCCLLPLTGMLAWVLIGAEGTKRIGQGTVIGLVAATALAVLAVFTGYAPPWISEGWTGNGWS